MIHFTILGFGYNVISMIFEILSNTHDEKINVDIVKNIQVKEDGIPYELENIASREINVSDWSKALKTKFILGVATPHIKQIVRTYFSKNFAVSDEDYTILIHPDSTIAGSVLIHNGVTINPGVIIAPYVKVEKFVSINRLASIGHHTSIGEYSQINPSVNFAGHCRIGRNVVVGMGTNIIENISIGDNSVIGAGSLVTQDIPENVVAYGIPARVVREIP